MFIVVIQQLLQDVERGILWEVIRLPEERTQNTSYRTMQEVRVQQQWLRLAQGRQPVFQRRSRSFPGYRQTTLFTSGTISR